jgi:hypothetical protein
VTQARAAPPAHAAASGAAAIDREDFLVLPITGRVDGKGSNEIQR